MLNNACVFEQQAERLLPQPPPGIMLGWSVSYAPPDGGQPLWADARLARSTAGQLLAAGSDGEPCGFCLLLAHCNIATRVCYAPLSTLTDCLSVVSILAHSSYQQITLVVGKHYHVNILLCEAMLKNITIL